MVDLENLINFSETTWETKSQTNSDENSLVSFSDFSRFFEDHDSSVELTIYNSPAISEINFIYVLNTTHIIKGELTSNKTHTHFI